jgi:SNF2 family DNA or RNA helicase
MGLGKTVQAMALILAHPSKDPKHKTTLIVAPLALLRQWEQEILTKIKHRYKLSTLVFHGPAAQSLSVSELLQHDVVLCTYAKLQIEFKNKYELNKPMKLRILAERTRFHRVILDEAHNIRNQNTYCSKAATEIKSTYRLCMTGTPFMNRAEEIFALIRFLRIPPYNEWERFSEDIVRPLRKWDGDGKDQAMVKLQALFRSFTLRRTKDSRLDGKPIIELPPRTDQPAYAVFKNEQREFYEALEVRQQLVFNKYLLNGAVMKNYMHILILLLRLRQACDHPFLLKNVGIPDGAKLDDKQMVKLACKLPADVLHRLKKQKRFECPLCSEATNNPVIVVPCGHHVCSGCFTASVAVVETEGLGDDRDDDDDSPSVKPLVPCPGEKCEHSITPTNIVCYNFLSDVPDSTPDSDDDKPQDDPLDYDSRDEEDADANGNLRGFVVNDDAIAISSDEEEDVDEDDLFGDVNDEEHGTDGDGGVADNDDSASIQQVDGAFDDLRTNHEMRKPKRKSSATPVGGSSGKKKSRKSTEYPSTEKKGKDRKKKKVVTMADQRQAAQRSAIAMSRYKARLRQEWISSAKIDSIMEILEKIRPSREKTLVFSLWTSFLDLVEIPIERANIKFTRYDGSMTPGAREAAVKSFMEDQSVEVMLVSLTAGNAGLNLTAASQVIVTEPFWNPFVEEQAIDRAHRFGQKRPVIVHRLLIQGTVEDRIVALQESKKMLVDAALSEKGAANVSRLNIAELRNLFGL